MNNRQNSESNLDFTERAKKSIIQTLKDPYFRDNDYSLIYSLLKQQMKIVSFSDYLKRYIYQKAEMEGNYQDIPLSVYQEIICTEFSERQTPCAFTPTSMRLRNAARNWLEQQTVSRQVVLLLGFGLGMSVNDVNKFLSKALQEYELNAKDPFEAVCWYCYQNGLSYLKFDALWKQYQTERNPGAQGTDMLDSTAVFREKRSDVHDDRQLMVYLSTLPGDNHPKRQSVSARKCFDKLYLEARTHVAEILTASDMDSAGKNAIRMEENLSSNDRMYDYEKVRKVREEKEQFRIFTADDVSPADFENVILSAVPKDKNGNLVSLKNSSLEKQFLGKRLSRQRLADIISGNNPITRYDLLTLLFFNHSQSGTENAKDRYLAFVDSANHMLNDCNMGPVYVANPYECFLLMCLLSEDPLGTYADVCELSYSGT